MRFSRLPRTGLTITAGALLLAGGALAGCGNGAASTAATGPAVSSPTAAPSVSTASSAPSAASKASATASASSGTPAQPAGGPVPAGFVASSVTFVSQNEGYVLGTAPCAQKPCTSILRTLDRGKTWRGLPAPKVPLGQQGQQGGAGAAVWGIRFASPTTGFVFGKGLWETTDGGEHWAKVPGAPTDFGDLEVSDGHLLGMVTSCPDAGTCAGLGDLMERPVTGGTFQKVTAVTTPRTIPTGYNVAAVLDGSKFFVTRNGGTTVTGGQTPCDTNSDVAAQMAVTGPDSLALLCTTTSDGHFSLTVYVSGDLGARWTKAGSPPGDSDPIGVTGGSASKLTVAAFGGTSELYYSPDGGTSWDTAYQVADGGLGFADLGFTTPSDGVVVRGPVLDDANSDHRPGQLLLTDNGGASWYPVNW